MIGSRSRCRAGPTQGRCHCDGRYDGHSSPRREATSNDSDRDGRCRRSHCRRCRSEPRAARGKHHGVVLDARPRSTANGSSCSRKWYRAVSRRGAVESRLNPNKAARPHAPRLRRELHGARRAGPSSSCKGFGAIVGGTPDAVMESASCLAGSRTRIVDFAAKRRLPRALRLPGICRGRGPHVLRRRTYPAMSTRRDLRGQDPQGREARRPARSSSRPSSSWSSTSRPPRPSA